jgi:hypothetical protein
MRIPPKADGDGKPVKVVFGLIEEGYLCYEVV